jgi:hypothetical protein
MCDKFGDRPSKIALAEWNQPIETFLFDRTGAGPRSVDPNGASTWR